MIDRAGRDWLHDRHLRRGDEEPLQALRQIVLLLDDSLTGRGVRQWFRADLRLLDGRRPLDLLAEGDFVAVRAAAAAFVDGANI